MITHQLMEWGKTKSSESEGPREKKNNRRGWRGKNSRWGWRGKNNRRGAG
jgi:hypothetical protein